ncbi:acetyl-CoA synthetase-like protein [Hortaea werneckii]|nr:acetyl-CoA synthetase-like protein [Hortaea werneckii]KAI7101255.1 acetyl-CoA synthetase-like protein [Hortaea werneckii]KAI7243036.1 acetyl-CoA synthetase-like protein [Hortaea werneckii]KAI7332990.1 acetyl-CoA synthetase-like protein [Hortaea werneckii]KAI7384776.1 acetyl-CoA synthetase-like protein [Hortaea werneckii]
MALAAAAAGGLATAAYLNGKYQIGRDLKAILKDRKARKAYAQAEQEGGLSPWYVLAETCARQPNDRAIWTREGSWTFKEFHDQTVRYAQWMLENGVRPGELVAMYLHNSAEFLMIMFATHCIGAGPALINYNLEGKALMHCLSVCDTKLMIVDADTGCQQRINDSRADIEARGTKLMTLDAGLKQQIGSKPAVVPEDSLRRNMKPEWPYALIYTSGTTGLPKGCPFTVSRTWLLGSHLDPPFGTKPGIDCWYSPMPLYHGTGIITTSSALLSGVGVAIAPRFSVKNFWPDIHDSSSTLFIYVGETARYLLAAPPHPLEKKHKLRVAYGNGLRPDVWDAFQERFNIPEVAEFFNSSEGMFALIVWDKGPYLSKCVGHHGGLARLLLRNTFVPVRIDFETGDIWRDPKTGFAERAPYEEGGEMLVAVPSKEAFGGYWRNEEATNKRFATDLFAKGDLWYRSGDALRRTPDGHWYFLDRLGDTFRWKSENVSTAEVAETLGRFPGVAEANVYGVSVPGHEGRAGCAAMHLTITPDQTFFTELLKHCQRSLPRYAVPVFLRIVTRSSHIHNHKQNKVGLRREGIDLDKVGTEEKGGEQDVFMWWQPKSNTYQPYERKDWEGLAKQQVKL